MPPGQVPVTHAPEISAPGFARNRGAAEGSAEWLVFIDADVHAPPDLLDRYFETSPGPEVGLLAGEIVDEAVPPSAPRWPPATPTSAS